LNVDQPPTDELPQVSRNSAIMRKPSDRENTVVRHPPARTQAGESLRAYFPTFCSSSVSMPTSSGFLDSADPSWTR
jgi:hypothetical protein